MLRFDHVTLAVRDLDATAAYLLASHGLAAGPARPVTAIGTQSRMVPLGESYLELVSAVDCRAAETDEFGRELLHLTAEGDRWCEVCLADDAIDQTGARLGLPVESAQRTMPDGVEHRWRTVGLGVPQREVSMPFFIEWDLPTGRHPSEVGVEHRASVLGIAAIEVQGSASKVWQWLGQPGLPIRVVDGTPAAILAVTVMTSDGPTELRPSTSDWAS